MADTLQPLYDEIKNTIENEVGEPGYNFAYRSFEGQGWLNFHYVCSTYEGQYPRIVLKQQKEAVHFYVMLWVDGKPILENYTSIFGKSSVGKSCIRIKKLNDERRNAIVEIIRLAINENKKSTLDESGKV